MSRKELAEAAGISESHLKKIEAGTRQPGIQAYERMMGILGAYHHKERDKDCERGMCGKSPENSHGQYGEAGTFYGTYAGMYGGGVRFNDIMDVKFC